MKMTWPVADLDRGGWARVGGGVASVVIAVLLYTRYSIDGGLSRDESIYVYGGQQLSHGVAPYASIFDPKAPVATMLCGLAAGFAHLIGRNDVHMIRLLFFACSVLSVLAIYLLVTKLWKSVLGGLAAAVVMASYEGFAQDALPGPDAKTPGVLFLILAMWLAVRRNWFWAGCTASLTFLVWQPFLIFPVMAVVAALVLTPENRRRALVLSVAGVLTPIAAMLIYFAAAGAFGKLVESTLAYPLTGVRRGNETVTQRIAHIFQVVHQFYAFSGVLFWIGAVLLVGIAITRFVNGRAQWRSTLADPLFVVVMLTGLFDFGYAVTDFQSYPDVFPLLPYPAIGIGLAVALAEKRFAGAVPRQAFVGAAVAATVLLTGLSAIWFTDAGGNNTDFRRQQAAGCALNRSIVPGTPFWSLGNPVPLVVTGRRNPDRYIYLTSGVDRWKVAHTAGGFAGWTQQIQTAAPSVVGLSGWTGKYSVPMRKWLTSHGYRGYFVGQLRVYATQEARRYALGQGVRLTSADTRWPVDAQGGKFGQRNCGIG